jgi:hypothetical protein
MQNIFNCLFSVSTPVIKIFLPQMHIEKYSSGSATVQRTFFSGLKIKGRSYSDAAIPEQFIPLKPGQILTFMSEERCEQLFKIHDVKDA